MATVTVFTADRMAAIEDTAIVSGLVDAQGRLILSQRDGTTITAGSVVGPQGDTGPTGDQTTSVKLPTDPPAAYPIGLSRFYINNEPNWPVGYAQIFTVNTTTARAFQLLVAKVTGRFFWRSADDAAANWSAWQEVASTGYVDAAVANGIAPLATTAYVDGLVKGQAIGNGVNLNVYTSTGVFTQGLTAQAQTGVNYPTPVAGILEVHANGSSFVWQRYRPYGQYDVEYYERSYYNGTWYPWKKISYISGGSTTVTTNASGNANIPHGLPFTPTWATVTTHGTQTYFAANSSFTSSYIVVTIINKGGTVLVSGSIGVSWTTGL